MHVLQTTTYLCTASCVCRLSNPGAATVALRHLKGQHTHTAKLSRQRTQGATPTRGVLFPEPVMICHSSFAIALEVPCLLSFAL